MNNADKIDIAKKGLYTAISRRNDDASAIAGREATQLVYGKSSPYGRIPQYATVEAVTLDDLNAWHNRTVVPNNMLIGISGDFDSAAMMSRRR